MSLARSAHIRPETLVAEGSDTALLWACHARLAPIVLQWIALPSCTRDVLAARGHDGASPFSAACAAARDAPRHLSPSERASTADCARAIAASPHLLPGDLGEHGGTALLWASWAGLPDVVGTMLASALCTREVVTARDEGGESAFSAACECAGDAKRALSVAERAAAAACASALAASPHLHLDDTSRGGRTALASACGAGLAGVVRTWRGLRCMFEAVRQQDKQGGTPASALLARAASAPQLTAEERRNAVACVRVMAAACMPDPLRKQLTAAAAACEAWRGADSE